jgi:hypothetical protein
MRVVASSTAIFLGTVLVLTAPALAQTVERLTDKDVKTLIEAVDNGRDRFEDQLDGKLKASILRGQSGEVNVARFLDDFQENLDRLKERFKPEYAASIEVATVLRQGSAVHRFMKQQSPDLKGSSEWDHLSGDLGRLAVVYGTKFPLEEGAVVRRINDGEAAGAAAEIEAQADEFKDEVNREKTLAKPAKDGLKGAADLVKANAKALKSRLKDSKPATAEARQLFDAIRKMDESTKGLDLSPGSLTLMGSFRGPLATLQQAFGVVAVSGT